MSLKCANHKDTVTEVRCQECAKPICKECRVVQGPRFYCPLCFSNLSQKKQRDLVVEKKSRLVGTLVFVLGAIYLIWGILNLLGWQLPLRFRVLGSWEWLFFTAFGALNCIAGFGVYSLNGIARWMQIVLSFLGILGILLFHPFLVVGAVFQIYALSILLGPKVGEVFTPEYRSLVSKEEMEKEVKSLLYAFKIPFFILLSFVGLFMTLVLFLLLFVLDPSFFVPTEVGFYQNGQRVPLTELRNKHFYRIRFQYEHHNIYPEPLYYEVYLDGEFLEKGKIITAPEMGGKAQNWQELRRVWRATIGNHNLKILMYQKKKGENFRSANKEIEFQVKN
ncbi:MAG: hypothetical protein D6785_06895 [Planctomycetota bacterium]|nr:MAG: hypothetical protein D6785_06895 [Planctomycetota bacterium]